MVGQLAYRQQIDKLLPTPITDKEWTLLVEEGYIGDVVADRSAPSAVAQKVQRFREDFGAPASRLRRGRRSGDPRTSKPRQDSRTRAIAALLAAEAGNRWDVLDFKVTYVQYGEPLKQDEVVPWLTWQAEQDGTPTGMWLNDVFVPPLERRKIEAALKHQYAGFDRDADGNLLPFKVTALVDPTRIEQQVVFREVRCMVRNTETGQDDVYTIRIRPNGVLDKLRQLGTQLARDFGWDEPEATHYVLTDVIPPFHNMKGFFHPDPSHPTSARVTLHIYPEVSPQEVTEYYRYARRQIMDVRPRELSEKHVQLACFAAKRPDDEKWPQRMAAWNQEYPKWRYRHPSNFSRDCRRAQQRLLSPKFHPPSLVASDSSSKGEQGQA